MSQRCGRSAIASPLCTADTICTIVLPSAIDPRDAPIRHFISITSIPSCTNMHATCNMMPSD